MPSLDEYLRDATCVIGVSERNALREDLRRLGRDILGKELEEGVNARHLLLSPNQRRRAGIRKDHRLDPGTPTSRAALPLGTHTISDV